VKKIRVCKLMLISQGEWGIFQSDENEGIDVPMFVYSKRLYYSPSNHAGVNELMGNFSELYPQVDVVAKKSTHDISLDYESNLFDTWASVEFELSDDQIASGLLIPSTATLSTVNYEIRICPSEMVNIYFCYTIYLLVFMFDSVPS
jgi:hypothetical protein